MRLSILLILWLFSLDSVESQHTESLQQKVSSICRRRPHLRACRKTSTSVPVQVEIKKSGLPPSPQVPVAGSGDAYCSKWTMHFNYYCNNKRSASTASLAQFCPVYQSKCLAQTQTTRTTNTRNFCQRNLAFVRTKCIQGASAETLQQCQEYVRFCGSSATGGQPVASITRDFCQRYMALVRTNCVQGASAETLQLCQEYVRICGSSAPGGQPVASERQNTANRCAQYKALGDQFCLGRTLLPEEYEDLCDWYKDNCLYRGVDHQLPDNMEKAANIFDSAVGVSGDNFNLGGIPYYPFNPEGAFNIRDQGTVDFGSWGGGFRDSKEVGDFWRQDSEVGANWYKGYYGNKDAWGVPLFPGIEGESFDRVDVPINPTNFGQPIGISSGDRVGDFFSGGKGTNVDWLNGGVATGDSFAVPFVGVSGGTGTKVDFPSIGNIAGGIPLFG